MQHTFPLLVISWHTFIQWKNSIYVTSWRNFSAGIWDFSLASVAILELGCQCDSAGCWSNLLIIIASTSKFFVIFQFTFILTNINVNSRIVNGSTRSSESQNTSQLIVTVESWTNVSHTSTRSRVGVCYASSADVALKNPICMHTLLIASSCEYCWCVNDTKVRLYGGVDSVDRSAFNSQLS